MVIACQTDLSFNSSLAILTKKYFPMMLKLQIQRSLSFLALFALLLPGCSDDDNEPAGPSLEDDIVSVAILPSTIEAPLFSELTFEATMSNIPLNVRYEWSLGETLISDSQNQASHVFLSTGNFQLVFKVIDNSDNSVVAGAAATVVITPNPDAVIEFANIDELGIAFGKYEVTQAQWSAVMGYNHSIQEGRNRPVENIEFEEIRKFIERLNASEAGAHYRLPSVEEWEFACRAGTNTDFYSGNMTQNPEAFCTVEMALQDVAWHCNNSENVTHDVGLKDENSFGLFDMHGNVWEMCSDIDVETERKVTKGGSALDRPYQCQVGYRGNRDYNVSRWQYLGFRLVKEIE